ncbi:MAG: hypothetical protein J5I91_07690 [Bacteroidetes bacterium]|nr:hypothetical protein [Bacteroidota bacterium]
MINKGYSVLFIALLLCIKGIYAGDFNTAFLHANPPAKPHSPHLASVLSAVVPGAGQVYNKKYWKVPVIYAGLGALTYSIIYNQNNYKSYQNELIARNNNDSNKMNIKFSGYPNEYLSSNRDFFRNNRDLSIIGIALLYTLNIVDAAVDAHLYNFDVNKSLSFKPNLAPPISPYSQDIGLGIGMVFRF